MNQFWSAAVHSLEPYVPGEQPKQSKLIKLNTNENPYGPSAKVLAAIREETNDSLRLYPDPNADELKSTLADYYGIEPAQVFVGNGSDEVLAHVFQGLLKHDEPLLFPDITYSFYPVYCGLYDIHYKTVPLDDEFQIHLADYQQRNGGIIFPNPNAPTGVGLALDAIETLLQKHCDSVVVVDEAYIDFGGESAVSLVPKYPNLLVIQTLSKSRSLAGLRVGFAMGDAGLIDALERVKNSFNSYPLGRLAQKGASAAMKDTAYFEETRQKIIHTRSSLSAELTAIGFKVLPSLANFIFAQHPDFDAQQISLRLRESGIIVRHFNQSRIKQFLRISIGTEHESQQLINALKNIISER